MALFTGITALVTGAAGYLGFSAAASAAIGVGAASIAKGVAANVVTSLLFRTASPSLPKQPKQDIIATLSQGNAERTRLYGKGLLGGVRALHEVRDGVLYQIILINDGRINQTTKYWINGRKVDVENGKVVSGPQAGFVSIDARSGNGGIAGASYPWVSTEFSDIYDPGYLQGQATIGVEMTTGPVEEIRKTWPRGSQTDIQWEGEGSLVFDILRFRTEYSDNACNIIGNYLVQPDGFGIPFGKYFRSSTAAQFAQICNEEMALKQGGTEPRYRIWGTVGFTEQPKNVLGRMLAACDARVYQETTGNIGIVGGKYIEPDVTITADDIYSFTMTRGASARERFNVVRSFYTDENNGYQDTEAQPWENNAALATEPEKSDQFDVVMSPSHSQTRRLMKIHLNRKNRAFTGKIVTNLVGIKAREPQGGGHHVIRVQYPQNNGFDEVCEVMSHRIVPVQAENGVVEWRCEIEIAAIDPQWWEWDPLTEEGTPAVLPSYEENAIPIPVLDRVTVSGTTNQRVVTATFVDLGRTDLEINAEIRRVGSAGRGDPMSASGSTATATGLQSDQVFEIRAQYESSGFNKSPFTAYSAPIQT